MDELTRLVINGYNFPTHHVINRWHEASICCRNLEEVAGYFGVPVENIYEAIEKFPLAKVAFHNTRRELASKLMKSLIDIALNSSNEKLKVDSSKWLLENYCNINKDNNEEAVEFKQLEVKFISDSDNRKLLKNIENEEIEMNNKFLEDN